MDDRIGDWIWTASGKRFWPRDPRPEEIDILDIARGAANENRFSGQTLFPYSVAERVCREVSKRLTRGSLPEGYSRTGVRIAALVHDAAECLGFRDLPAPLKYDKTNPAWMLDYRTAEKRCQEAIFDWAR